MKTRWLHFLTFVALTTAAAPSAAWADLVPVGLDLTLRGYRFSAEASCSAHGDWTSSHIGNDTFNPGGNCYESSETKNNGQFLTVPYPHHQSASAEAQASMTGYDGGSNILGRGSISGNTSIGAFEPHAGTVTMTCITSASGECNGYGSAIASCYGTTLASGTLHVGTSAEYPAGTALWLRIEVESDTPEWGLQIGQMVYDGYMFGMELSQDIAVYANEDIYNIAFAYGHTYDIPPPYGFSESNNAFVTLTLMDVPEPSALTLLFAVMVGLAIFARCYRNKQ